MKLFFVAATAAMLISCSKPAQENVSSADSTASAIPAPVPSDLDPVSLSADEADRVGIEIFLRLRSMHMYEDAGGVAYKEEFDINGNEFKYTLLRHNADNAGYSTQETTSSYREPTDEEIEAWKADSTNVGDPPLVPYVQTSEIYTMEIDTFYISGTYATFRKKGVETSKDIICKLTGTETHQNEQMEQYSTTGYASDSPLGRDGNGDSFGISLGTPLTFDKDFLYVKAKIKDLTNEDLVGLSKEELSFIRNDIFARHGHTFKTAKMIDHYKAENWYHAVIDDAAPLLNKLEKINVEFIKKKEG